MFGWRRAPIALVNARVVHAGGEAASVRFAGRVLSLGEPPRSDDTVVDVGGRFVLPGLINAHDHLELNHYGPLKCRERYDNASAWIDDLRPIIGGDPGIRALSRLPLSDRLFIGGLKNLLAGATTVAHHNPLYRGLTGSFPVRVPRRLGWAHSLGMQHQPVGARGEPGGIVAERAAATPSGRAFIVHAAEGTDAAAAGEIDRLDRDGALRPGTVLVHGVGVPVGRWRPLFARGVGLVWCPASNLFLLGRTVCMSCLLQVPAAAGRVCLGSDSRLTGARDLLDELRVARACGVDAEALLRMVTTSAADLLQLPDAGRIEVGAPADLIVVPAAASSAAESLLRCARRDLALIVRCGTPIVADDSLQGVFRSGRRAARPVDVDGVVKLLEAGLASRLARCAIAEPGVRPVDAC